MTRIALRGTWASRLPPCRHQGVSLLEVVVAMALIAVLCSSLLHQLALAVRIQADAQFRFNTAVERWNRLQADWNHESLNMSRITVVDWDSGPLPWSRDGAEPDPDPTPAASQPPGAAP